MSAPANGKQPTVFILYIPGGAMLGLIPALTLSRIESLTETPTPQLFQVIEGVSTGSILAAGFAGIPDMTAKKGAELFAEIGPTFFPHKNGRWAKMSTRQGLNTGKIVFGLDPLETDALAVRNIRGLCRNMRAKNTSADPALINQFEAEATARWLTPKRLKTILKLAGDIAAQDESLKRHTEAVSELISTRTYTGRLSMAFKTVASGAIDRFKEWYAPEEDCLYDPDVAAKTYKDIFGDKHLSDSSCSTFISAYDIVNKRIVTFSSLKGDLFNSSSPAPAHNTNDIKLWDAVMASTANEFAWKAHITENDLLCTDKAPFHKPRSVKDVLAKVPKGTKVVLVIAGTGKHLGKDLLDFMEQEEHPGKSDRAHYREKLEAIRDRRANLGVAGNLILGQELPELEAYTMSDALEDFGEKIGRENIFEISPRLTPYTPKEKAEFPSRDALDASEENIKRIIQRGREHIQEEDQKIRQLSQMLVDNMYILGRMDREKYVRVSNKIGVRSVDIERELAAETKAVEGKIVSNDNSVGLVRAWNQLYKRVFGGSDIPPPTLRPKNPSGPV